VLCSGSGVELDLPFASSMVASAGGTYLALAAPQFRPSLAEKREHTILYHLKTFFKLNYIMFYNVL
jgi:hypothetical protein